MLSLGRQVLSAAALVCGTAAMFATAQAQEAPAAGTTRAVQGIVIDNGASSGAAQVDSSHRLLTQAAAPSQFFHSVALGLGSPPDANGPCAVVATPPEGKTLILQQVRVSTVLAPSPGPEDGAGIYLGKKCAAFIGDVFPSKPELDTVTFGPGFVVTSAISMRTSGGMEVDAYVDGYLVPKADAPTQTPPTVTEMAGGKRTKLSTAQ
ncbi:MAG: hypothetical protein WBQ17_12710 [Rhizomicrobium sp.]|jgi:hypothetical protein